MGEGEGEGGVRTALIEPHRDLDPECLIEPGGTNTPTVSPEISGGALDGPTARAHRFLDRPEPTARA